MESQPMVKFIPYNRCLECGDELVAVQTGTDIIRLDKGGLPISYDNVFTETKLRCVGCGKTSDTTICSMRIMEKSKVVPIKRNTRNAFGFTEEQ